MKRLCLVFLLAACSGKGSADYLAPGSYDVGEQVITVVDTSRPTPANGTYAGAPSRTLKVNVWYPTVGGTVAPGTFPLILHSHGFLDSRDGEAYLGEHLASRGYIVAAPDYPLSNAMAPGGATLDDTVSQPGDASFVIDQLLGPSSPLPGSIDATRIAASGLSLGGLTTLLVAVHPTLRDPRIRAALPLAAPSCFLTADFFKTTTLPIFFMQGDSDVIVSAVENSERAFGFAQGSPSLGLLARGTHTGFVGVSTLFDQTMDFDRIGCPALAGKVDPNAFAALGGPAQGISSDLSLCPMPCDGHVPFVDPPLGADRQQDLTRITASAFFDAELKADTSASAFLAGKLASENSELSLMMR
jgi:dienelactone hydrolase